MKLHQVAHQGDVFIKKISDKVENVANITPLAKEALGLIVQHGEAVGHYHVVRNPDVVKLGLISLKNGVKKMILTVNETTELDHAGTRADEIETPHGSITLTPGTYEIHTQREQRQGFLGPVTD